MKIQLQAVIALALASGGSAFAPSTIGVSTRSNTELPMASNGSFGEKGDDVVSSLGKSAMSFAAASALAFSTSSHRSGNS